MRAVVMTFVGALALATSVRAAPVAPTPASMELRPVPPIELVDHACGSGLHRVHWQDHLGYWHWHCVPYGYAHHGRTNLEHPYSDWRGPTGGFGNP